LQCVLEFSIQGTSPKFQVAFPGTICNVLVAKFTRTLPTLNNSFGRLTASQAAGEAILCAMFAFYYVPMVFLDIEAMKEFSRYVGIVLLICYDICIFSHLIIALNRMSAIVFPVTHTCMSDRFRFLHQDGLNKTRRKRPNALCVRDVIEVGQEQLADLVCGLNPKLITPMSKPSIRRGHPNSPNLLRRSKYLLILPTWAGDPEHDEA
ncbi:hypothetical protein COOONC_18335, partial [Cooperia oncophora]